MNGNFNARCMSSRWSNDKFFTTGKIYKIKNGVFTYDSGHTTESRNPITDINDLNYKAEVPFELVEEPKELEIDVEKFIVNYYLQKASKDELLAEVLRRISI